MENITTDFSAMLRAIHAQGVTQQEIARKIDITQSGVSRAMKRQSTRFVVPAVYAAAAGLFAEVCGGHRQVSKANPASQTKE